LPLARKMWLSPDGWPVRGWIMQQITKLSASFAVNTELILFADSDLKFIRFLNDALFYRDELLRLHRVPGALHDRVHRDWHRGAAQLLGSKSRDFGSDYVGQLITWRRSNLQALHRHLELIHGVLGIDHSGHFYCSDDICHCCWFTADAEMLRNGAAVISGRAQAVLLQSNLGLRAEHEAELLAAAQHCIQPIS